MKNVLPRKELLPPVKCKYKLDLYSISIENNNVYGWNDIWKHTLHTQIYKLNGTLGKKPKIERCAYWGKYEGK